MEAASVKYPSIRALTARSLDLLITNEVKFPEKTRRLIDVSQSSSRAKAVANDRHLPCCRPNMNLWLTDFCRPLLGQGALRAQGISWGHDGDQKLMNFSNELLLDLARNAFHTGCCAAAFVSVMASLGIAIKHKAGQRVHSILPGSLFVGAALLDDDEGSDADLASVW